MPPQSFWIGQGLGNGSRDCNRKLDAALPSAASHLRARRRTSASRCLPFLGNISKIEANTVSKPGWSAPGCDGEINFAVLRQSQLGELPDRVPAMAAFTPHRMGTCGARLTSNHAQQRLSGLVVASASVGEGLQKRGIVSTSDSDAQKRLVSRRDPSGANFHAYQAQHNRVGQLGLR
ncbi:hypothetical protein Cob_v002012 [Colletotrichum orbiculare MAFF 240422]|uniref:Uncharacterized protein n=1 Tax=Colletotrichum orbiculare (strain 104-T / ATCC 96160 / CBS 514.97 / LARS 414 / MAFF 240422) TaxID=1213857 RepID=A0A484G5D3_COLOR|nr:hypothetical protein Cob_v002012 [Colletotrichum orbiculare MAFF 240422]